MKWLIGVMVLLITSFSFAEYNGNLPIMNYQDSCEWNAEGTAIVCTSTPVEPHYLIVEKAIQFDNIYNALLQWRDTITEWKETIVLWKQQAETAITNLTTRADQTDARFLAIRTCANNNTTYANYRTCVLGIPASLNGSNKKVTVDLQGV